MSQYVVIDKNVEKKDDGNYYLCHILGCFDNQDQALDMIQDDGSGSQELFGEVRPSIGYTADGKYVQVSKVPDGDFLVTEVLMDNHEDMKNFPVVTGKKIIKVLHSYQDAELFCNDRFRSFLKAYGGRIMGVFCNSFENAEFQNDPNGVEYDSIYIQYTDIETGVDYSVFLQIHDLCACRERKEAPTVAH